MSSKVAIFGNFCFQKLPKMATLPRKFCRFWQPLCNARFFFPILAIHKIAKIGKTCLKRLPKMATLGAITDLPLLATSAIALKALK